ncbi:MAG: septum formation initiator family protein [Clostridia bacterium]|nr:septum formation initiator family protein [Clostridia bacterium]
MNKRKRQGKPKRKLNIRVCLIVVFAAYLSYTLCGQLVSLRQSAVRVSQLEAEIAEAEGRLAEVQDLDRISKSDAYIEKVAREKLGLVQPDETVFVDVSGR